jgi:catechol 2,3-dioxygenase-like lactoylglutathione lyase family enzyme
MAIQRMDHVGVVVGDLAAATAFFAELGLELEGEAPIEGRWVDQVNGLDGVRVDIVMMRTPDGHGGLELTKFRTPAAVSAMPENAPPNTLGLRNIMFAVDDIDDVVARRAVRGQLPALLRPRPRRHHRRAGRAAQLKRSGGRCCAASGSGSGAAARGCMSRTDPVEVRSIRSCPCCSSCSSLARSSGGTMQATDLECLVKMIRSWPYATRLIRSASSSLA